MSSEFIIDYEGRPKSSFDELYEIYSSQLFIVDNFLSDIQTYTRLYQDILDLLKYGFENKDIREMPIKFKFHNNDKKVYTIQIRHLLSNLILWYGFMETDTFDILDETYIHDFRNSDLNMIIDYIDEKILPVIEKVDLYTKNKIVDEITHNMTAISTTFSPLMGLGISVYSIIQAANRNPEIEEIMKSKLNPDLQPIEIEQELDKRTNRLIELFCKDTDNDLRPLFLSGKNLSTGQFKEIAVMIGLKSDINGNTIPVLIDKNIMIDGISTPSAYYLDAVSGRKSLILTKTRMGEPGAFSKKATTNTTPAVLRQDYQNCNSVIPLHYIIRNDTFLKMLNKRYYYDNFGSLKCLDWKTDKHLIGHRIPFKSPCTCTSEEGVCKYCYGELYEINKDLSSAGAFAGTKETEYLGQAVLSSKHLQLTHSNLIKFVNDFYDVFELNANEITIRQDTDLDDELFIIMNNVQEEESEDSSEFFCTSFDIVSSVNKLIFHVEEENTSKMYLTEQMLLLWKKQKDKRKPISLESFDDDSSVLFNVEIKNKELTKPIQNINKLLNTNEKLGCKTIDEVCQMMADMKLEAGTKYDFVHHEMIIRELIRKASNEYEKADFSPNGDPDDYTILRLNDALFKNPSPILSLSYGYLKKQLLSPEFYLKSAPSHLDTLFTPNLSKYID